MTKDDELPDLYMSPIELRTISERGMALLFDSPKPDAIRYTAHKNLTAAQEEVYRLRETLRKWVIEKRRDFKGVNWYCRYCGGRWPADLPLGVGEEHRAGCLAEKESQHG